MEIVLQQEPTYLKPDECARQFANDLLEVCLLFYFNIF